MEKQAFYRSLLDNSPAAIYVLDQDARLIDYNQTAREQIRRYVDEDLISSLKLSDMVPEKHRKNFLHNLSRALEGESIEVVRKYTYEQERIFRVHYRPLYDEKEEVTGVSVYVLDITEERRQIEQSRRRAEQAIEGGELGLWEHDLRTDENIVNDYWFEMLGYNRAEIEEDFDYFRDLLHPEDRERLMSRLEEYYEKGEGLLDMEIRLKDSEGNYRWIRDRGQAVEWDDEGKPVRLVGTHLYIDDRKRSEERIRQLLERVQKRERQLAESQRMAKVGSWEVNMETGEVTWSDENFRIFGMDPERDTEPRMEESITMFHPDDRSEIENVMQQGLQATNEEESKFELDSRIVTRQGKQKHVNIRGSFKEDDQTGVKYGFGTTMDITERKKVEMDLQYTNATIRALIQSAPVAIYTIDSEGTIIDFWNEAAEEMFGWKQEEVIGNPIPYVKENQQEVVEEILQQLRKGEPVKREPLTRYRKDGSSIEIALHAGPILDREGELQQGLVVIEDITEQQQQRRKIEESLKEKEVLLSEVHHRVKNNLAIINSLLQMQVFNTQEDSVSRILNESQNRIQSIAMVHELLYNTESFSEISVEKYLDKFMEQVSGVLITDGGVEIQKDIKVDRLSLNEAIPLGLLFNEMITNSIKHAFEGDEEGTILIEVSRSNDNRIMVTYRDDGKGLPDDVSFDNPEGLGLTIVKTLLRQLDAEYTLRNDRGFELQFSFSESPMGSQSNLG